MNSRIRSGIFGELLNRSHAARFNVGIAILAFGIFLLGLLWGVVIFKINAEKGEEIQDAMKHTANLARVIEEHTVRTIREAEQLLLFIMDLRRTEGAKLDLRRIMEDGPLISRIYTYLSIIDEQGMLAAGSAPFKPIDLSDREHFRVHVAQDTGRLFISKPVIGRASGTQSIQLTRRINKPDLTFGGVAVASVDPAYFSRFYGQLDLGKQGVVTLIGRNDGIIRARRAGADTTIGQDVSNTPLFSHLQASKHGSYESVSTVAGVRRIVSYRSVADYPLVIFVAVGAEEALAAFNERVRHYYEAAVLVSLVILAFTALLLLMVSRQTKAATALRGYTEQLRQLSRRLFKAEENERRRLARELHDRIGQNVTALSLNLNMLRAELPADYRQKLKAHLDDFDSLLSSTSKLVRDVLVDLRPPGLDELGLLAALNEHARQVAGRVTFTVAVNGSEVTPRLPAAAEIMLFRIAQEALTNIAKHAQATAVTLTLEPGPDTVVLTIADNGRGINVTPATAQAQSRSSLGMVSMRERAESIGATLHVESMSGRGTRVIVEAPRTAPDADDQPHLPGSEVAQDLGVWSPARNIRKDAE